ncbi:unnamed protein product [Parascedosporium putredinis]|uniref:DUF1446 domain-containing protein n=1 Tax=Parascedosporium putredinis TaxID=1442378 RepID=A0A9P1M9W1_9PEZI|nr:unnamed protein product [Parascedosporium putredinis]CAI7991605.1 unnamed protein product [Parascedosporium putredinis]
MAERKRAVRIANCSGAASDPGMHMYNQARFGQVDGITGDYLAEMNLANFAVDRETHGHPGWAPTALDGLQQTIEIANEKRIKIVINGGAQNPKGLAEKTHELVREKGLNLTVAYVDGDDQMANVHRILRDIRSGALPHLDNGNDEVQLAGETLSFLDEPDKMPVVSSNAYLGYRAIKRGLDEGADIVICGRVADASPVIGLAAWWHAWSEDDLDQLAGSLVAGHLIECSTYVTGANFAGAYRYPPETFINLGLPIVEIEADGSCVVTKHPELPGFVTADTVKCQLLYELQGDIYLNSDVKADIARVRVSDEGEDRVRVTGVRGHPPPPTTKLATFYKGGFQCEMLINATGYATAHKWDIQETQMRAKLAEWGVLDQLDELDFQRVGVPMENPDCQLASTTYLRIFAQAKDAATLGKVPQAWMYHGMAHFAAYRRRPAQADGTPRAQEQLRNRGPRPARLLRSDLFTTPGDIALARSGDKGANVNIGLYVQTDEQWAWFRAFMTRDRIKSLMGRDWLDWYFVERVEMPEMRAVHFVIYGHLGRGVSSSKLLDGLGKGFAEFIRAVHVPIPTKFLLTSKW